jgi:hypothetical protein
VNLLVLLLITYHSRAIIQSLEEKDLVLIDLITSFAKSGLIWDIKNYQTMTACLLLVTFCAFSFYIEKLAAAGTSNSVVSTHILIYEGQVVNFHQPGVVADLSNHRHIVDSV